MMDAAFEITGKSEDMFTEVLWFWPGELQEVSMWILVAACRCVSFVPSVAHID